MFSLKITQAELNKLKWIEHLKNIPQVDKKKEYIKRLKKREKLILQSLDRVKNNPKYTFFNHLWLFMSKKDITPTMIEKEEEWAEYLIIN